jgi:general secretion pathway protein D
VPVLGDIPLLGNLFKHTVTGATKSELLIFLTPHVVTNPGDLAKLTENERAKMEMLPKPADKDHLEK